MVVSEVSSRVIQVHCSLQSCKDFLCKDSIFIIPIHSKNSIDYEIV